MRQANEQGLSHLQTFMDDPWIPATPGVLLSPSLLEGKEIKGRDGERELVGVPAPRRSKYGSIMSLYNAGIL